jgi:hypothetical protein
VLRWLPIVVAFVVSGCTAAQTATEKPPPTQTAAVQPDDDTVCQAKGPPGSAAYVQCRKDLDKQHYQSGDGTNWSPDREAVARGLLGRMPAGSGF